MNSLAMTNRNVNSNHRILLIDGYGFVFRAYYSMPPLTNPYGTPVGAVYGFTNMLMKLLDKHDADYVAVVLDAGSKTFRNNLYREYKANRPPAPDDLIPQFPLIREASEALDLPTVDLEGFEADDLIATYTRLSKENGYQVRIISSDKDLMQLIDDDVEMYDPIKSKVIAAKQVEEKFGVQPDRMLDLLSLTGDSADNIPGVPGIGPKTAADLINHYGSLDAILDRAAEIKQNKRRETLINYADDARLSRDLVRLCDTVDVPLTLDKLLLKKSDKTKLMQFAQKHGFSSIISKLEQQGVQTQPLAESVVSLPKSMENIKKDRSFTSVVTHEELTLWFNSQREIASLAVYIEKDKAANIFAIALSTDNGACFIPIEGVRQQDNLFGEVDELTTNQQGLSIKDLSLCLGAYLQDASVLKISNHAKSLMKIYDGPIRSLEDVSLMSYMLEAGRHGHEIEDLAYHYLGVDKGVFKVKLAELDEKQLCDFVSKKADMLLALYSILSQRLYDESMLTLYRRIETPLIKVLSEMELAGIKVCPAKLKSLSDEFCKRINALQESIFALAGREFNIGSPKQLGEVLFDEMCLDGAKKSKKSGTYSTGADILEALDAQGYAIAGEVLKWRQLSKLKNTYTDALAQQIGADGRVHTHFAMQATSTGRLSSYDPNLQNIPIRTDEGNRIREAFVAKDGYKLISADYSQIELRLLADIANIDPLKAAFFNGDDVHAVTASQMFHVPLDQVDKEMRRKAKVINFGIIYGISAFGLSNRLGISRKDAADYIKQYFIQYPGIELYMQQTIDYARKHGYVTTLFGRKCHLENINSKNGALRSFSERAAINAPLQGTAADIIKKAMIALVSKINESEVDAKLLLQVHDELIVEASENQANKVASIIKDVMEGVFCRSVPLVVDIGIGDNWKEIH